MNALKKEAQELQYKDEHMKGIIFTEFLEMVNEVFSPAITESIIEKSDLASGGAYTDVGTYDHQELISLVSNLSRITDIPVPDLEVAYGKYLFKKLFSHYSDFSIQAQSTFEFLQQVDKYIHVEVLKLYPEAELPRFECKMINPESMLMEYRSNHPFASLAHGLILGCAEHFNENINIQYQEMPPKEGKSNVVLFTLKR